MSAESRPFANRVVTECGSTNDLARELALAGAPHGTWVSARRQTAGRGRHGRAWSSQEGNLYFSCVLRLESARHLSWVPIACAVAVAQVCEELGRGVRLKWPNDLWVAGDGGVGFAKAGGILCEGLSAGSGATVIAGIGLNCAFAPEFAPADRAAPHWIPAASLGLPVDAVRALLARQLPALVAELSADGPRVVAEQFAARAVFEQGAAIGWSAVDGSGAGAGTVVGLGPSGELRVRQSDGSVKGLYAEEVRVRPVRQG